MEQDFTVVNDYITGLKCNMHLLNKQDLIDKSWAGQVPPLKYLDQDELSENTDDKKITVPKLKDFVKTSLKHFNDVTSMDWTKQVVPVIDENACVQCGKCYLSCLDSG